MVQIALSELKKEGTAPIFPETMALSEVEPVRKIELPRMDLFDFPTGTPKKEGEEKPSVFSRISEGIDRTIGSTPTVTGNVMVMFGEELMNNDKTLIGTKPLVNTKPLGRRMVVAGMTMIERNQKALREKFPDQEPDFFKDLGGGFVSLGFALGLTALTKSPVTAGVAFGVGAKSGGFVEARQKGKTFQEASNISDLLGIAEGSLEFIGIDRFFKAGGGSIKQFIKRSIIEGTQEFSQSVAGGTIRTASGLKEYKGFDTWTDILTQALYEGILGSILGGAASIPISIAQRQAVEDSMVDAGMPKEIAKQKTDEIMAKGMSESLAVIEEDVGIGVEDHTALEQKEKPEQKREIPKDRFRKIVDARLEEELGKEQQRKDELEVAEIELEAIQESTDFLKRRINKSKNPEIKEELQELPSIFATTEGGISVDEAMDEMNTLGIAGQFETTSDFIAFLQLSVANQTALKKKIERLKPIFIKKRETTVLKEKLKNVARGFRRGQTLSRQETKAVQGEIIQVLNASDLEPKDKAKFISTVKNIQTVEQFEKFIPQIEERIGRLEMQADVRQLKSQIKQVLKRTKPRNQFGKPIGNFTPEIQDILDRARSALSLTQEEAQDKIQSNLSSLKEDEIPSEEMALENRILSMVAGLENKNPSQLRETLDDLEALTTTGRAESILGKLAQAEHRKDMRDRVLKTIIGNKPPDPSRRDTLKKGMRKTLQKMNNPAYSLSGWDDLMDVLSQDDKTSKPGKSDLSIMTKVSQAETAEKKGMRVAQERIAELGMKAFGFSKPRQLFRKLRSDLTIKRVGEYTTAMSGTQQLEMSVAEMRKLWMEMQDPTLRETFEKAHGYTFRDTVPGGGLSTEQLIEESLTTEDITFAQLQMEFYKKFYNRINKVYSRIFGVNLPQNDFYSPISRRTRKENPSDAFLQEIGFRESVTTGSLKSRIKNIRPIKEQNDIDVIQTHVVEMEHFINWVDKIRDLNAVFGDSDIRETIEQKYGRGLMSTIDGFIQDFTRGGVERARNYQKILDHLRINFTVSALALKPAIAIKQTVSFLAYAEFVPTHKFVSGTLHFLTNPIKHIETLNQSEVLKARGQNITRDIKDIVASKEFALFKQSPSWKNALLLNVRFGDKFAIVLGGWSVYKNAIDGGKTHQEALRLFEEATSATQQSGDLSQLSEWQRGGPLARLFTMFTSAQNQYFRREIGALRNFMKGRITPSEFTKKMMIYHFLLPMLFQWVVDIGRWKPEEQIRAAILGSLNGIFIMGDMIDTIVRMGLNAWGELDDELPVFDQSIPAFEFGKGIERAIQNLEDPMLEDVIIAIGELAKGTVGPITGTPIKQLIDGFEGAMDISEDELERGLLKLMGWSSYIVNQTLDR